MRDIKKYPPRPLYDVFFEGGKHTRRVHQDWITLQSFVDESAKQVGLDALAITFYGPLHGRLTTSSGFTSFKLVEVVSPVQKRQVAMRRPTTPSFPSKLEAQQDLFA